MGQKHPTYSADDAGLKRLAQGIFLQLPNDLDEAAQVLAYMNELLKWHRGTPYSWLDSDMPAPDTASGVLTFMKRG